MKVEIEVEVKEAKFETKSGTSKAGRSYTIREQESWAMTGKAYPERLVVTLEDGQAPFPVGRYVIREDSVYINRYGQPTFSRLKLHPLKRSAAA